MWSLVPVDEPTPPLVCDNVKSVLRLQLLYLISVQIQSFKMDSEKKSVLRDFKLIRLPSVQAAAGITTGLDVCTAVIWSVLKSRFESSPTGNHQPPLGGHPASPWSFRP